MSVDETPEEPSMAERIWAQDTTERLLFPQARIFSDLFEYGNIVNHQYNYRPRIVAAWDVGPGRCYLTSFCSTSPSKPSLDVQPRPFIIDVIYGSIMKSEDYRYHFEIVDREDKSSLVLVKYDRIIGSRWLAVIDPNTVPCHQFDVNHEVTRPVSLQDAIGAKRRSTP